MHASGWEVRQQRLALWGHKPPLLSVLFPLAGRKHGAEAVYAPRALVAGQRELAGLASRICVLEGKGAAIDAEHLKSLGLGTPAQLTVLRLREHQELSRPLRAGFGDSPAKVRWRSGLVLDFVRGVQEARRLASGHLLWLEDDVELLSGFRSLLTGWLAAHGQRRDWVALRLLGFELDPDNTTWGWGTRGWGGKGTMLYNGALLDEYIPFVAANFDAAPLDWLVDLYPPPPGSRWWTPELRPVRLRHFGQHSTHGDLFL